MGTVVRTCRLSNEESRVSRLASSQRRIYCAFVQFRCNAALPDPAVAQYFLVAVTGGVHDAGRQFIGGGSSGSYENLLSVMEDEFPGLIRFHNDPRTLFSVSL